VCPVECSGNGGATVYQTGKTNIRGNDVCVPPGFPPNLVNTLILEVFVMQMGEKVQKYLVTESVYLRLKVKVKAAKAFSIGEKSLQRTKYRAA
jgi:hypothetical protein